MGEIAHADPYLVWTDETFTEQGATQDFYMDLDCGTDETYSNTFAIQLDCDIRIKPNAAVFVDGAEWGGLVQRRITDTGNNSVFQWEGRTWHGVLSDKIIEPASGQDYYIANGTVSECVSALITKLSLGELFACGDCPSESISNYQFHRYVDGYVGLCEMLASVDLRPSFRTSRTGGVLKVMIDVGEIATLDEIADGELANIEMTAEFLPPNHVIGLGKGELHERYVVNYYANASGVVSTTQTFTGVDERVIKYDSPSAENADLQEGAQKFLQDAQTAGEVEVNLNESDVANIGDLIVGYDQRVDARVTVPVVGQVVKIENGVTTISCKAGGSL